MKGSAINTSMEYRPICQICGKKPAAINYKMHGKTYFRKRCDSCIRKKRNLPAPKPRWHLEGNKKKLHCEKCGFIAEHRVQLDVDHIDGNNKNNDLSNLQTLCANCHRYKTFLNKDGSYQFALVTIPCPVDNPDK